MDALNNNNVYVRVKLILLTPALFDQIPANEVMDMGFKLADADVTFVAQVMFGPNVSFYTTCSAFRNTKIDRSLRSFHPRNRVAPSDKEPDAPRGLDHRIADMLVEQALELAQGKTFQFYRIICRFESIYDKPQTCCCGLLGFNGYELFVKSSDVRQMIRQAVSDIVPGRNAPSVSLDLSTQDTLRNHGHHFLP